MSDWPVICSYTREQAINDGVLVDVTQTARKSGFRVPVALTSEVYNGYVVPKEGLPGQDIEGRLRDLLLMLYLACRHRKRESILSFRTTFLMDSGRHETKELKAVMGPGDKGEPVLTVMLPNQD